MGTNLEKIRLKLVMDKSRDKVLFAEADSTFVDFLIYTLSLPLSAVGAYLTGAGPGCIGKLRLSLGKLDTSHYIQQQTTKSSVLEPHLLTHVPFLRRLTGEHGLSVERTFYQCIETHQRYGADVVTDVKNSVCGVCRREMSRMVKLSDSSRRTGRAKYVKDVVKYMVTDELSVLPLDSTAVFGAVKVCGNPGDIMEKYVEFGSVQALELMKAMVMQPENVLTSVFLKPN